MVSNVTVPLLGAVDTAVVGHLPQASAIGAVALGATVFSVVFWSFGFLRIGTTGFAAQALGAGDGGELRAVLARAGLVAAVFGLLVIAAGPLIVQVAVYAFNASAAVEADMATYVAIRIWGAPAVLAGYALTGWLIGLGRMRAVLVLQLTVNLSNIVLDIWFVFGFGWGIPGVAVATVIAHYLGLAVGLWLARSRLARISGRLAWHAVLSLPRLKRLLAVNTDIFIRSIALIGAFAWFNARSAELGDLVLAGNAILMHFLHIMAYGLDGFAHAAETLAGQAYGAGDRQRFRRVVTLTTIWAGVAAVLITLGYAVTGEWIIALMTDIADVRVTAGYYLLWAIPLPLISVWSFQLDGLFIGATRTADMRNGMLISLAGCVAAAVLLQPVFGNDGLWASIYILMVLRAVTLAYRYPALEQSIKAPKERGQ